MFIKLLSLCNIIFDLKNCIDLVKLILLSLGKNMVYYKLNNDLYGIEIYFESKPDANVIKQMKDVNLLWNHRKKCWFTKQWNKKGVKFIKEYCSKHENLDSEHDELLTFDSVMVERCCYKDLFSNFKQEVEIEFIEKIKSTFIKNHPLYLNESQINAWVDSFRVMQNIDLDPNIHIIFEYVLPYESGRRPDIILLSKNHVVVLEFKMKEITKREDIDQVDAYVRDLMEYHYESRNKEVIPILVLTKTSNFNKIEGNVVCISPDLLEYNLNKIFQNNVEMCDVDQWISSKYEPLPTIVEAARNFMKHEDIPNIKRVNSTNIPKALDKLKNLTDYARDNKKHVIAFVTGVPGAGKTYLGLQYVYDIENENSIYFSGNGPLIKVLQDALKSKTFVRDLHNLIKEYEFYGAQDFKDNVIVFDEGQRAWNKQRMQKRNKINLSEPEVMIEICEKSLEWCVLLILVGEGQQIHNGENSGMGLWNIAINNGNKNWEIVCPPKLFSFFDNDLLITEIGNESFDLTVSLRSHLSGDLSRYVNYIMSGEIKKASNLSKSIYAEGYNMYCTRNLEDAKSYCKNRYFKEPEKRYGLIASSKDDLLKRYGIYNDYNSVDNVNLKKWFNAPSSDPNSSCALKEVITEFKIQGLELDMSIVCWESDMIWSGDDWEKFRKWEDINSDANTFRINSYRVLLTRGRDGFIIFVPPVDKLNSVYEILIRSGIKDLTEFI